MNTTLKEQAIFKPFSDEKFFLSNTWKQGSQMFHNICKNSSFENNLQEL